jgi:hypothetical protein
MTASNLSYLNPSFRWRRWIGRRGRLLNTFGISWLRLARSSLSRWRLRRCLSFRIFVSSGRRILSPWKKISKLYSLWSKSKRLSLSLTCSKCSPQAFSKSSTGVNFFPCSKPPTNRHKTSSSPTFWTSQNLSQTPYLKSSNSFPRPRARPHSSKLYNSWPYGGKRLNSSSHHMKVSAIRPLWLRSGKRYR